MITNKIGEFLQGIDDSIESVLSLEKEFGSVIFVEDIHKGEDILFNASIMIINSAVFIKLYCEGRTITSISLKGRKEIGWAKKIFYKYIVEYLETRFGEKVKE